MTECNIPAYTRLGEPLVPGCAGYLLGEWFEVAIVDPDTDAPLPPGAVGEITVRPKVPGVFMAGYFHMPDEQVPPGTLEIERELVPAVGDKDIASSQGNRFAATGDPSLAFKVDAGGLHVTAR